MEKKLYTCNYTNGYFTFWSDDDSKENDATNLAFEHFGIDAEKICGVGLADEDETLEPVNVPETSEPKTLDELLSQIKSGAFDHLDGNDWAELPIFGGSTPANTQGVWSWDETRLLIGTCKDDMEIINRPEIPVEPELTETLQERLTREWENSSVREDQWEFSPLIDRDGNFLSLVQKYTDKTTLYRVSIVDDKIIFANLPESVGGFDAWMIDETIIADTDDDNVFESNLQPGGGWHRLSDEPETPVEPEPIAKPGTCYFCHRQAIRPSQIDGKLMCARCRGQAGR